MPTNGHVGTRMSLFTCTNPDACGQLFFEVLTEVHLCMTIWPSRSVNAVDKCPFRGMSFFLRSVDIL